MKRVTLYSSSRSSTSGRPEQLVTPDLTDKSSPTQLGGQSSRFSWRSLSARHRRLVWLGAGGLLALIVVFIYAEMTPPVRQITQEDINAAVLHTLENNVLPSPAAKAYEVIQPSIVRVRRLESDERGGRE